LHDLLAIDRLTSLDSAFVRLEAHNAHMHVGWVSRIELPPAPLEPMVTVLRRQITRRLHLVPRFRQRLAVAPGGIAEPAWVDDPTFSIERHVTLHSGEGPLDTVPSAEGPLDERELQLVCDEFLSRPLDRSRPLWEVLVIPRLGGDGREAAVVGKVHHALVDGVAAVELGMLLFDVEPDEPRVEDEHPPPWSPSPPPPPLRLAVDAVVDSATQQFRAARSAARLGLTPGRGLRVANSLRRAAMTLAEDALSPAPASYLNREISARRALTTARVDMERLQRIKRRHEVKLNDVVLCVAAGALREVAASAGERPEELRVMVPVSVRGEQDPTASGNRIVFALVDLPVDEARPRTRLEAIRAATRQAKEDGRIMDSDLLLRSMGPLPGPVKTQLSRLATSPRLYNLVISNVPGPARRLYAGGTPVTEIYPVIPLGPRNSLSIGVLTYAGGAHFAAHFDPHTLPQGERLPGMLQRSLRELEGTARAGRSTAPTGARSEAVI